MAVEAVLVLVVVDLVNVVIAVVLVVVIVLIVARVKVTTLLFDVEKNGSIAQDRPLGHVNELQSVIFFGIHFPI